MSIIDVVTFPLANKWFVIFMARNVTLFSICEKLALDSDLYFYISIKSIDCYLQGWFYFHSGDRWFANFWKGKANGGGRFYSKDGSIFFGHFQNGWRHGECLYIDVDGSRY